MGSTFTQEAAVLLDSLDGAGPALGSFAESSRASVRTHEPTASDTEELFLEGWCTRTASRSLRSKWRSATSSGWIGTVDFLWRRPRHIVEVDSTWHDGPLDSEADEQRDRRYVAAGYTVSRYRYGRPRGRPRAASPWGSYVGIVDATAPRTGCGGRGGDQAGGHRRAAELPDEAVVEDVQAAEESTAMR